MVLIIVAQKANITQPAPHVHRTRTIGNQTIILENAGRRAFHLDEKKPFNRLVNECLSNRGQVDGIDKFEAERDFFFNGQTSQHFSGSLPDKTRQAVDPAAWGIRVNAIRTSQNPTPMVLMRSSYIFTPFSLKNLMAPGMKRDGRPSCCLRIQRQISGITVDSH